MDDAELKKAVTLLNHISGQMETTNRRLALVLAILGVWLCLVIFSAIRAELAGQEVRRIVTPLEVD